MTDLFKTIRSWLLQRAISDDADLAATIKQLAHHLIEGGVPVARIAMGRVVLHPVIAVIDIEWSNQSDSVDTSYQQRDAILRGDVSRMPFGDMSVRDIPRLEADLRDPEQVERYEIFGKLSAEGMTNYVAFKRHFGDKIALIRDVSEQMRGAGFSFTTRRFSGFSQADIDGLESLIPALCVCARVDSDRHLANEILKAYLGPISSERVLQGLVSRGDGYEIDCAVFYSDLRNSVSLSLQLDASHYLETLNAYFECTATAVAEHGGEVLKFVGDGVLAIFPFDDTYRPRKNMCAAALSSAREAFARADFVNKQRQNAGLPLLEFGVALHAGQIIYGNVGTDRRLDFTATGSSVGLASRVEALTRTLDKEILATRDFTRYCDEAPADEHKVDIRNFPQETAVFHYGR